MQPFSLATVLIFTATFAFAAATQPATRTLSVRNAHAMAYDDARHRVVLFGGADAEQVRGDTWEWDGRKWAQVSTDGPSPRTFAAMTYDHTRRRILLFGGNRVLFGKDDTDYTFYNDLWEWDGKQWRRLMADSPPARAEAAFAYDERRQRAVLFGGYFIQDSKTHRLGDTWEWDGRNWVKVSDAGPSPRNGVAMSYDHKRGRVVLFGGNIRNDGADQTWEWDGRNWHLIASAKTEPRFNVAMCYDEARSRVIRFGGWNGNGRVNEMWEYDGESWRRLAAPAPSARNHTAMVYDRARRRVVLFGGHEGEFIFGDTWEWEGKRWQRKSFTEPQKRVDNGH